MPRDRPGLARSGACFVAVLVTFAWGCGPQSQSDRVKATVNSFFAGLGHPSGSLCDLLSASYVKRRNGAGGAVGLARCRRKAEAAAASGRKVSVSRVVFNDVKVSGSTATVNVSSSQGDLHLTLVNEGGGWKIDSGL